MELLAGKLVAPSIEKAKSLLWPFQLVTWLKLAMLSIFMGGMSFNTNFRSFNPQNSPINVADIIANYWGLIIAMIIIIALWGILFSFLRAVFQFCFLDSIAAKNVQILGYFKKNIKKGTSLFLLDFIANMIIANLIDL